MNEQNTDQKWKAERVQKEATRKKVLRPPWLALGAAQLPVDTSQAPGLGEDEGGRGSHA